MAVRSVAELAKRLAERWVGDWVDSSVGERAERTVCLWVARSVCRWALQLE